jgi:hypothetical protein
MERHTNPLYRRGQQKDRDFSEKVYNSSRLAETEEKLRPFWIKSLNEKEQDTVRHLVTERDLLREVLRLK